MILKCDFSFLQVETVENKTIQTTAQPSTGSSTTESRDHPVSNEIAASAIVSYEKESMRNKYPSTEELDDNQIASSPTVSGMQKDSTSAIARPRVTANKNVNLMDASPWQLLPPPSGKLPKGTSAKKSLKLEHADAVGSDPCLSSPTSSEGRVDSLVNIEEAGRRTSPMHVGSITPDDFDRLNVKRREKEATMVGYRNLSKEKSRSIDSLRSDISESSMFEWKRQTKRR